MFFFNKYLLLKEIPLFAALSADDCRYVAKQAHLIEYKKGKVVYEEGSSPSGFYCIIFGRVVVYTVDREGKDRILEYLHRGKYFGIISLLTGESHSVTARALNDCLMLFVPKKNFSAVLKRIPLLAVDLSQTLSRRLKRKDLHEKTIFESTIISVYSPASALSRGKYAVNLALSLRKETKKSVVILDICHEGKEHAAFRELKLKRVSRFSLSGAPEEIHAVKNYVSGDRSGVHVICLSFSNQHAVSVKNLVNILGLLVNDYHYIVLNVPDFKETVLFNILHQSNVVHLLCGPDAPSLKKTGVLARALKKRLEFSSDKIKLIIDGYETSQLKPEQELKLAGYDIFATLPDISSKSRSREVIENPNSEFSRALRRISRHEGACLVGLALGVGFAYGFCHIGVFKVIEEEKIPVDVISGASMGALLASLWVTGRSSKEILEITRELKDPRYIWNLVDLTLPSLGFIKGKKLYNFLKRYLGNKTFQDTRIPLKIIASDLKKKQWIIMDKGLLLDAIMVSCSMPGIFTPFKKEKMLFDGGVIRPLPTEPLFEMGVKKIIAVNVTPSRQDIEREYERVQKNIGVIDTDNVELVDSLGRVRPGLHSLYRVLKRLSPKRYLKEKFQTNILDIIFSSFEVMQSEMAEKEAKLADLVLHPDVTGLHWLDLHKADDFALRGELEARRNLRKMWSIIKE